MTRTTSGIAALLVVSMTLASWTVPPGASAAGHAGALELLIELDGQGRLSGTFAAALQRASPVQVAPVEAGGGAIFNLPEDAFTADAQLELPASAFTVEGWVAVETPRRWGGVIGAIEDNGAFEKGWILGYDESVFTFGISTAATDDGDGRLVILHAAEPYLVGHWHHVAATYDGSAARLFVDGVLSAESTEAQGPVVMADSARLTIGAYHDSDESFPHDGRIADLRFYDRALDISELQSAAAEGAGRASREPWTDAVFEWTILPYLTWPRTDGVSVLAETRLPGTARLFVREDSTPAWTEFAPASADPVAIHEFIVRGLKPDTKHFYRMSVTEVIGGRQETTLESERRSFRTAPMGDGRAFTFTVVGDTQTQGDVAKRVCDLAFEQRPNFVVHCGDLVDTGSAHADWTDTFFPSMRPLIEHAPLVPVLGNHEQDARLYYDLMSLPDPERWYSLRYGHAEFFMLDGNRSLDDQSEQLRWLKGALAESDAIWRFAVLHQPPYTSDSNDYGDTAETTSTRGDLNVRNIVETLEEHGIDICFSGHVHDYERTFPIKDGEVTAYKDGGIIYVTAAGGGGHLEDFDGTNTWFGHKKMRRHHFVYVAIHGDELELQAMDEDGRMFDVLTLTQRGR